MKISKSLYIIPVALVSLTTVSGLLLSSTITKADGNTISTDAVSITVDTACTMTGGPTGESTTDNTYTATIDPGTYSEISGSKLVTVCNDALGYSIYAIGFSGDSYDTDNTKLLGQGTISGTNINTGTSGTNSYWAMKLQAVQGLTPPTIETGWNDYHVIPDTYTQIAEYANSTASPSDAGASVQTKYKVNISSSQTAGSYQGKVKYTMVHPNNAPAPTPPAATSCTTPVPNLTYMQDLNFSNKATILASMTEDQQYFLKDARDEKSYCVAKLKDGNIWMTQNLDHDIVATENYYTNQNTDIGWNSSTSQYGTAAWTPVATTHASDDTEWNEYDDDTNPDGGDDFHAESYDPGNLYWNGYTYNDTDAIEDEAECTTIGATWYDGRCYFEDFTISTGNSHYHLGNYYNWNAAIAMNNTSGVDFDNYLAEQSICPTGWTLPTTETFYGLTSEYDGENVWDNPLYIPLLPWDNSTSAIEFWTSEDHSEYYGYALSFYYSYYFTSASGGRGRALFVRCVAR